MKRICIVIALIFFLTFGFESNGMGQWVRTSGPIDSAVECLAVSGSSLFAGTTNGVYRSTNNGDDWTPVMTAPIRTNVAALVRMGTDLFAATSDSSGCSTIYRSIDDGITWTQVSNNFPSPYECTGVLTLFVKDTNLFVGAACGGVFHSTDRGGNWNAIDSGIRGQPDFQATALAANPTNLFVRTDVGDCSFGAATAVFRSTNNGVLWSLASDSIARSDLFEATTFALLGSNLFAGANQSVYQWTDSNSRWSRVGKVSSFGHIQSLFVSASNIFAALDGPKTDRLFLSSDSAKTWRSVSTGLENASQYSNPYQLAVNDRYVFVGIIDRAVWRRPLSDFAMNDVQTPGKTDFNISVTPNPTTGILTVHDAPINILHITVSTLLGETILELSHPNAPEFTLDLSKLPPGTYFARFSLPNEVIMRKIIKE